MSFMTWFSSDCGFDLNTKLLDFFGLNVELVDITETSNAKTEPETLLRTAGRPLEWKLELIPASEGASRAGETSNAKTEPETLLRTAGRPLEWKLELIPASEGASRAGA
nr:hypothetical protein Iba_chr01cCG3300 [Ipomoea batatas]